jgi:hypothetical protein
LRRCRPKKPRIAAGLGFVRFFRASSFGSSRRSGWFGLPDIGFVWFILDAIERIEALTARRTFEDDAANWGTRDHTDTPGGRATKTWMMGFGRSLGSVRFSVRIGQILSHAPSSVLPSRRLARSACRR